MVKFYPHRTVDEQKARLPQAFQANYEKTVLDQVEIDGNIIRGYMEYSFLNEKSYFEQPTRSTNGAIENINTYATFLTPRLVIKYSMMNIEDYRKLMLLLQSKNEFTVTCYDIVQDKRVTHKMYAATPQMPVIYQQYLMALGVQEFTIELIGTNNNIKKVVITYDFNIPQDINFPYFNYAIFNTPENVSIEVGANATYNVAGTDVRLNSDRTFALLGRKYVFQHWNTEPDGSGFTYIDGVHYIINSSKTLYAQWR